MGQGSPVCRAPTYQGPGFTLLISIRKNGGRGLVVGAITDPPSSHISLRGSPFNLELGAHHLPPPPPPVKGAYLVSIANSSNFLSIPVHLQKCAHHRPRDPEGN